MPEPKTKAAPGHRIVTRDELNRLLWGAADILRGTVDAGDFKNHILALMFLKRLSDVFKERRGDIIDEWVRAGKTREEAEKIAEDPDEYTSGSYYLPEGARWDDLMAVGENRAEAIDKALHAIEEHNAQYLEGVLAGVRFNDERRFGDVQTMDAMMQRLLTHFGSIPLGSRNLAEPDVLGNAYEYLIERFAEGSGKKGGEFYTPRMVVRLIVQLLKPAEGMRIHDPTCGSGGMLIECGHYVVDHGGDPRNITLTGQEKNYGTWSIAKLNMLLHNFPDTDIRAGDTIGRPRFETAGVLDVFDRVIANPPFSLKEWHGVTPKEGKDGKPGKVDSKEVQEKFKADPFHRFTRGVPPTTKGDTAFLQHMVEVAGDHGMVGVVMPHGVLFRGGSEAKVRKALLEEDLFEAVIGLPEKLFFGTGIPASVLILNKNKPKERQGKVLFIDASPDGLYHEGKNRNYLRQEDLLRITAVFNSWNADGLAEESVASAADATADSWLAAIDAHEARQLAAAEGQPEEIADRIRDEATRGRTELDEARRQVGYWLGGLTREGTEGPAMQRMPLKKFATVATLAEIAEENDYNLNISRYVDSSEPPPRLDVQAELVKLRELEQLRNEAEQRMNRLLEEVGYVV
ncbi:type I restriction-modification system subunit M [Botrimarina mediterranea]|uniref:site-specific DNA-methyltransferase (adenine-specific) n=1 Tax=Botrimarina mediterranea TaxID=2528022 RepID=A0A518K7G1_9BACT|nr:class I SAM-dependent DNA methyltransferase [Botrimarina mediterranea]QDV73723.1 Type I restriction enzyme EcoKI M protein [Botrimarina mediterranea]